MTTDDILRMARDAGLHEIASPLDKDEYRSNLERFAALVAAAERDECAILGAKTMEDMGRKVGGVIFADGQVIADAIRARGKT